MTDDPVRLDVRPGTELPGGSYTLGPDRHERLMRALQRPAPGDGSAHPMSAWVIALGGCGVSIGDLFETVGVPMEDGPMLGSCRLELHRPLGIATGYAVTGRVTGLVEKTGRKLGRFDVLTLQIDCAEPGGAVAATCTASMILPRPERAAG